MDQSGPDRPSCESESTCIMMHKDEMDSGGSRSAKHGFIIGAAVCPGPQGWRVVSIVVRSHRQRLCHLQAYRHS